MRKDFTDTMSFSHCDATIGGEGGGSDENDKKVDASPADTSDVKSDDGAQAASSEQQSADDNASQQAPADDGNVGEQ